MFKNLFLYTLLLVSLNASSQTEYVTEENIAYYPTGTGQNAYQAQQCRLDIYYPKNKKDFATIIWFHGGGITAGKKEIPEALKKQGHAIIGVGYRLSPQAKAPAYIEDAAAAVAWAFKNIKKYGGSENLIFVSGHSAGGYLGMMIAFDKKYLQAHQTDANNIAGLIPFSGQAVTHFTIRKEQGISELQSTIDEYAPIYHIRKDIPPTLLITGDKELELFGRYEENAYLHRMIKLSGNTHAKLFELQGYDHGAMAIPAFPLLLKEVEESIKRQKH